jgi:hypothetical protein
LSKGIESTAERHDHEGTAAQRKYVLPGIAPQYAPIRKRDLPIISRKELEKLVQCSTANLPFLWLPHWHDDFDPTRPPLRVQSANASVGKCYDSG